MKVGGVCAGLALLLCCAQTAIAAPLKIGVIESLTGVARDDGQTVVRALQLAASDIEKGGAGEMELIVEDDGSRPEKAEAAYQNLRSQAVSVIIGGTSQDTLERLIPLAAKDRLVLLNTTVSPEAVDLAKGEGYVFTDAYPLTRRALERFCESRKIETASLLMEERGRYLHQAQWHREAARRLGVRILDEFRFAGVESNGFSAVLLQLQQKRPDATFLFLRREDVDMVLRRSSEIKLQTLFFGGSSVYTAWKAAQNKKFYEGTCMAYPLRRLQSSPPFTKAYKERYKEEPRLFADTSYDALLILYQALDISRRTQQALPDVLRTQTFTGVFDRYKYQETESLSAGAMSLVCIERGEPVIDHD